MATAASTPRADHLSVRSQAGPAALAPMTPTKHQSSRLGADLVLGAPTEPFRSAFDRRSGRCPAFGRCDLWRLNVQWRHHAVRHDPRPPTEGARFRRAHIQGWLEPVGPQPQHGSRRGPSSHPNRPELLGHPRRRLNTRRKNQALFTILLLALGAVVVMPFVMGGTAMMTSVGMYPGVMGGHVGVGRGMLAGGVTARA